METLSIATFSHISLSTFFKLFVLNVPSPTTLTRYFLKELFRKINLFFYLEQLHKIMRKWPICLFYLIHLSLSGAVEIVIKNKLNGRNFHSDIFASIFNYSFPDIIMQFTQYKHR